MKKRVVITASGIISPLGNTPETIVSSFRRAKTSFDYSSVDRQRIVSPVAGFELKQHIGRFKDARYLNRGVALGVAAAMETIRTSGLTKHPLEASGLFAGGGPNLDVEEDTEQMQALWILKYLPNTMISSISKLSGIHGENAMLGNACAASTQAIGEASRKIRDGYLTTAFAGGGDSRLSYGGLKAYRMAQALYQGDREPTHASRPFDEHRNGFVPGEGGAFFLLEEWEHALARKAPILAEIKGYGASMDGHNMTAPEPQGIYAEKAVRQAIREAGIEPQEIDLVSSHGTGTPLNDQMESDMLQRVFQDTKPHVLALKSWMGHMASSCGALELGMILTCLQYEYFPEIRNLEAPCHPELNLMTQPKAFLPTNILLENFGFGGQNAALVIRPYRQC